MLLLAKGIWMLLKGVTWLSPEGGSEAAIPNSSRPGLLRSMTEAGTGGAMAACRAAAPGLALRVMLLAVGLEDRRRPLPML
jgi:hypothetical protein